MRNLRISLNIILEFAELSDADVIACNKALSGEEKVFVLKNDNLYCLNVHTSELSSFPLTKLHPLGVFPPVVDILFSDLYESTFHAFHCDGQIRSWTFDENSSTLQFSSGDLSLPGSPIAIKRSPDQEYLAVVTEDYRVLLVDSLMTLVEEHRLNGETAGEQVMVNVGWGKKETQFHGSEGKAAAVAKPKAVVDHSSLGIGRRPVISWRGDGDLFAVGYWSTSDDRRRIKIFNRAGILQCCDEGVSGLDEPLSWKPQGSVIAVAQNLPSKNCVSFFEKNGLKHGEFSLPESWKVIARLLICPLKSTIIFTSLFPFREREAISMDWNSDSKILCILCEEKDSTRQFASFWTCGNYHWYLKQTLPFENKVRHYVWDETKSGRITFVTENGTVHVVQFDWTTDHSQFSRLSDEMFVSVIDNSSVLVTPFKQVVIPPPMSLLNFKCEAPVNQVLYPPKHDSSEFVLCTVLSKGGLAIFSLKEGQPELAKTVNTDNFSCFCHWEWIETNKFVCYWPLNGKKTRINVLILEGEVVTVLSSATMEYPVISSLVVERQLVFLTDKGGVVHFYPESGEMAPPEKVFPELCTDVVAHDGKLFGLSNFGRLFMNETQIASSVSSFLIHSPYVLTTTYQHNMLILAPGDGECEEVSSRKLENGSRLVAATGHSVFMQLPRGNLETIQPRVLIVSSAGALLDKCLYHEAVALMKRQRIDLNLVVDHNTSNFLANISKLVKQVDPKSISLLVTELKPDDSTAGIYSNFYKNKKTEGLGENKLNVVCEALLREMTASSGSREEYAMPILSCLVRMRRMSEAIDLAKDDRSIKDLCFLVDVTTLYTEALGVYNLRAALKFASKSQMDPKEYIPYLNSLKAMDSDYMKYTIDKSLKKYKSALSHLAKCGDDKMKEFLDLLTEHSLYSNALTLFETNSDTYKLCANLFGDYLKTLKRLDEATVMYERAGELSKVLDVAKRAGNWRKALVMARRLNYSTEKIEDLGEELHKILTINQAYNEAGRLAKELGSVERSVSAFLHGRCWEDAIYVASNSDYRILETSIKDCLKEAFRNSLIEIDGKKQDLSQYVRRLKIVRAEKAAKPKYFVIADNMSETSSVTSSKSSDSVNTKSSRMTRKMSRKLWSLKEGNPREEEALVKAVSDIVVSLVKTAEEVKSLNLALIELNLNEEACELQNSLKVLLTEASAMKREVWPNVYQDDDINIEDEKLKFPPSVDLNNKWEFECLRPC